MSGRVVVIAAGLIGGGALLGGCGRSRAPDVASLTTRSTTTGRATSPTRSRAAFAACLTTHGFAASVGGTGDIEVMGVSVSGNADPGSPQFQSAIQACRTYLPGGGPPSMTPAQKATWVAGLARFAMCIRRKGAPSFPGPNAQGWLPLGTLGARVFETPAFQTAYASCRSLLPSGPGLPHISLP